MSKPPSWYDAFPAPGRTAPSISRDNVLPTLSSPELLLVDVRRTDYEGGTIKGSINLPAQSFYTNRAVLYDLSSSGGSGTRCSGWFADYLAEKGEVGLQSLTLAGGIKGWVKAGDEYTQNVDGYQAAYWTQFD
ncbi:hypothetical protein K491DRAFT_700104 [Lophiostoma macrostomum CBS 122681]|uniref:Rhodanese domain-containing protein n=1 Tax=Lophiostoma macrostomum CBS 122681 TaxID=1314788 RepID=A0A6A6TU57_9PLEO|nr:hypothetical protein K491DRAFT_700104 [Lophiostoma macrostomum CBS 122681]